MQTEVLERPGEVQERRPMHRKNSLRGKIANPQNFAERLVYQRDQLKLTQEEVSNRITFWNDRKQENVTLSRSAYCMYESGKVTPDLPMIHKLAGALETTPQWLAFGTGEPGEIEVLTYDQKTGEFVAGGSWKFDPEWIKSRYDADPSDLALFAVEEFTGDLAPGDMAVVRKGVEPGVSQGHFAYVRGDELQIAHITRPGRGPNYRIYSDSKTYDEVPVEDINILGRKVGKIG